MRSVEVYRPGYYKRVLNEHVDYLAQNRGRLRDAKNGSIGTEGVKELIINDVRNCVRAHSFLLPDGGRLTTRKLYTLANVPISPWPFHSFNLEFALPQDFTHEGLRVVGAVIWFYPGDDEKGGVTMHYLIRDTNNKLKWCFNVAHSLRGVGHTTLDRDEELMYSVVVDFLDVIHIKNVVQSTIAVPPKLAKAAARRGNQPFYEYKVLEIKCGRTIRPMYPLGGTRAGPKFHTVIGHFKNRATGRFWWMPHVAGNKSKGTIFKDYSPSI